MYINGDCDKNLSSNTIMDKTKVFFFVGEHAGLSYGQLQYYCCLHCRQNCDIAMIKQQYM